MFLLDALQGDSQIRNYLTWSFFVRHKDSEQSGFALLGPKRSRMRSRISFPQILRIIMISSANNTHFLQECLSATARVGRVTNLNLGRRCLHRLMPLFRSRFYGIVG